MGSGVFNVAVSGLNAAQLGIQTTSHNIANASTEGYSRQRIVQTTNTPVFTGAGFVGQGTNVETVQRMYSQYLNEQVLGSASAVSEMDTYLSQINQIDNLLADPDAGLSPAMADFFKGTQELAANPSSIPARQAMISSAQALVARFQGLDTRIQEVRDGSNQQILAEVQTINDLARSIGQANQQIILAQSSGPGHAANDLLDQRDQLIADLNTHIKVQAVRQSDGTYNIFIGNGQPVVVGTQVSTLSPAQSLDDPERVAIMLDTPFGNGIYLRDSQVTGGNLGGLLKFRNESLDLAQNNLGRVAVGMADAFNQIHNTGLDLAGVLGKNFFTISDPTVYGNSNNVGTGQVTAKIISCDYRLEYQAGSFLISRVPPDPSLPALAPVPLGFLPTVLPDGITIDQSAAGAITNGDVFIVRPGNPPGQRVTAESTNTAGSTLMLDSSGSNLQALTGSDYSLTYDSAIVGGPWRLTRLSDNTSFAATSLDLLQQSQPGFSLTLAAGVPTDGDTFLIQPTRAGARNIAVVVDDPRAIAAAAPFRTAASGNNSGLATISSGSVAYVSDAAFGGVPNVPMGVSPAGDIQLQYFANNPLLGGASGFTVTGPGGMNLAVAYDPTNQTHVDVTVNGLSFTIAGRPNTNDTFTLSANENGVADNRTAQRLGALQTTNVLNGPAASFTGGAGASFQSAYSQLVSQIGSKTREVEVTGKAQASLVAQATESKEQLSGVNLDEEAANLLKYQQAYQAAAKMLAIVGTLFDDLLRLGG